MNYKLSTPEKGYSFDNLELVRAFENAQGSEKGFILVHIESKQPSRPARYTV